MKLVAAVCARGRRAIRRISGRAGVSSACAMLILAAGGLSADSLTPPSGGFLYSQYLKQFSPDGERIETGETGISAGSFMVRSSRPFYASGGDAAGAALQSELDSLPLNRWAADLWNDNEDSAGAAALDHARGAAWRLGDSAADSFLLAATEGARARGSLRNVGVELRSDLGARNGHVGFYALGALGESLVDATAWEVRGYTGGADAGAGGSAGLIYRRAVDDGLLGDATGEALMGANIFLDYENSEDSVGGRDGGGFYRWSAGGEYRTAWLDFSANFYFGVTDPAMIEASNGDGSYAIYTADGQDAEVALRSPDYPEFSLIAGYYRWEGEFGEDDEDGLRAGLRISPYRTPFSGRLEFEDTNTDRDWGGRISFNYQFGNPFGGRSDASGDGFLARDWFFAPVERTYSQRIRTTHLPQRFIWTLAGIEGTGAVSLRSADIAATVSQENSVLMVDMAGSPVDVTGEDGWLIPTRLSITLYTSGGAQATVTYRSGESMGTLVIGSTVVLGEMPRALLVDGMMVVSVGSGEFVAGGRASESSDPVEITLIGGDADAGLSIASRTEGSSTSFEALLEGGAEAVPSAACEGAEEMIGGGLNVVCAVDPYFAADAGRIAGIHAARGSFHEDRAVATVGVMGGVTLSLGYSVSVSGAPAGLAYDAAASAVILSSGASVGGTHELTLVVDDESDRTPAATAALTVLVAGLDFNPLSASIAPAPSIGAIAYQTVPRVVATVIYGGGSGSLTLSAARSEGALILNEANGEISLPSAVAASLAAGQSHVLVAAVSDTNSDNEDPPAVATVSVVITEVLDGVFPTFGFVDEEGATVVIGDTSESSPYAVFRATSAARSVAHATGEGGVGVHALTRVAGSSPELEFAGGSGTVAVNLSPSARPGEVYTLIVAASDESADTPNLRATLFVSVRFDPIIVSVAGSSPLTVSALRTIPLIVATIEYSGGSGALALSLVRSAGDLTLNPSTGEVGFPSAESASLAPGQTHVLIVSASDANVNNDSPVEILTLSVFIRDVVNRVFFQFRGTDGVLLTEGLSADSRLEIDDPESGRSVVAVLSAAPGQGSITYALRGTSSPDFELESDASGAGTIYILPTAEDGDTPNIAIAASSDSDLLPNTLTLYARVPYPALSATLASDGGIVSFEGAGRHVANLAISGGTGNYTVTTGLGGHADVSCLSDGVISLAAGRRTPGDMLDAVCEIGDTSPRNADATAILSVRLSVSLAVNHISIAPLPATLLVTSNPLALSAEGPFLTLSLAANSMGNGSVEFVRLTGSSGQLSVDGAGVVSYGPEAVSGVTLTLVAEARDAGAFSDASENGAVTLYARAPYQAARLSFSPELTAAAFSFPMGDPAVFSTVRVTNVPVSLAIEAGTLSVAAGASGNENVLSAPSGLPSGNYEMTVIASYLNPLNPNGPSSSHPVTISVTAVEHVEVNSLSFEGSVAPADPPPLISLEYSPLPQVVATILAEKGIGDYRHFAISAQTDPALRVDPVQGVVVAAGRAIGTLSMAVSVADGGNEGDARTFDALVTISVSVGDPSSISAWLADPQTGVSLTAGASSADPVYVLFPSQPRPAAAIRISGGTGEYTLNGPVPEGNSFTVRLGAGNVVYAGPLAAPGSSYGVTVTIADVGAGSAGTADAVVTLFFQSSPPPVVDAGFQGDVTSGTTVSLNGVLGGNHAAATLRGDSSRLSWEAVESSDELELDSAGGAVSVVYRSDQGHIGGGLYSIVLRATYTEAEDAANVPIFRRLHVDVRNVMFVNRAGVSIHMETYGEDSPLPVISGQSGDYHAGRLEFLTGGNGAQVGTAAGLMYNSSSGRIIVDAGVRALSAALAMTLRINDSGGTSVGIVTIHAAVGRQINDVSFGVSAVATLENGNAITVTQAVYDPTVGVLLPADSSYLVRVPHQGAGNVRVSVESISPELMIMLGRGNEHWIAYRPGISIPPDEVLFVELRARDGGANPISSSYPPNSDLTGDGHATLYFRTPPAPQPASQVIISVFGMDGSTISVGRDASDPIGARSFGFGVHEEPLAVLSASGGSDSLRISIPENSYARLEHSRTAGAALTDSGGTVFLKPGIMEAGDSFEVTVVASDFDQANPAGATLALHFSVTAAFNRLSIEPPAAAFLSGSAPTVIAGAAAGDALLTLSAWGTGVGNASFSASSAGLSVSAEGVVSYAGGRVGLLSAVVTLDDAGSVPIDPPVQVIPGVLEISEYTAAETEPALVTVYAAVGNSDSSRLPVRSIETTSEFRNAVGGFDAGSNRNVEMAGASSSVGVMLDGSALPDANLILSAGRRSVGDDLELTLAVSDGSLSTELTLYFEVSEALNNIRIGAPSVFMTRIVPAEVVRSRNVGLLTLTLAEAGAGNAVFAKSSGGEAVTVSPQGVVLFALAPPEGARYTLVAEADDGPGPEGGFGHFFTRPGSITIYLEAGSETASLGLRLSDSSGRAISANSSVSPLAVTAAESASVLIGRAAGAGGNDGAYVLSETANSSPSDGSAGVAFDAALGEIAMIPGEYAEGNSYEIALAAGQGLDSAAATLHVEVARWLPDLRFETSGISSYLSGESAPDSSLTLLGSATGAALLTVSLSPISLTLPGSETGATLPTVSLSTMSESRLRDGTGTVSYSKAGGSEELAVEPLAGGGALVRVLRQPLAPGLSEASVTLSAVILASDIGAGSEHTRDASVTAYFRMLGAARQPLQARIRDARGNFVRIGSSGETPRISVNVYNTGVYSDEDCRGADCRNAIYPRNSQGVITGTLDVRNTVARIDGAGGTPPYSFEHVGGPLSVEADGDIVAPPRYVIQPSELPGLLPTPHWGIGSNLRADIIMRDSAGLSVSVRLLTEVSGLLVPPIMPMPIATVSSEPQDLAFNLAALSIGFNATIVVPFPHRFYTLVTLLTPDGRFRGISVQVSSNAGVPDPRSRELPDYTRTVNITQNYLDPDNLQPVPGGAGNRLVALDLLSRGVGNVSFEKMSGHGALTVDSRSGEVLVTRGLHLGESSTAAIVVVARDSGPGSEETADATVTVYGQIGLTSKVRMIILPEDFQRLSESRPMLFNGEPEDPLFTIHLSDAGAGNVSISASAVSVSEDGVASFPSALAPGLVTISLLAQDGATPPNVHMEAFRVRYGGSDLRIRLVEKEFIRVTLQGIIGQQTAVVRPRRHGDTVGYQNIPGATLYFAQILTVNQSVNFTSVVDSGDFRFSMRPEGTDAEALRLLTVRADGVVLLRDEFPAGMTTTLAFNVTATQSDGSALPFGDGSFARQTIELTDAGTERLASLDLSGVTAYTDPNNIQQITLPRGVITTITVGGFISTVDGVDGDVGRMSERRLFSYSGSPEMAASLNFIPVANGYEQNIEVALEARHLSGATLSVEIHYADNLMRTPDQSVTLYFMTPFASVAAAGFTRNLPPVMRLAFSQQEQAVATVSPAHAPTGLPVTYSLPDAITGSFEMRGRTAFLRAGVTLRAQTLQVIVDDANSQSTLMPADRQFTIQGPAIRVSIFPLEFSEIPEGFRDAVDATSISVSALPHDILTLSLAGGLGVGGVSYRVGADSSSELTVGEFDGRVMLSSLPAAGTSDPLSIIVVAADSGRGAAATENASITVYVIVAPEQTSAAEGAERPKIPLTAAITDFLSPPPAESGAGNLSHQVRFRPGSKTYQRRPDVSRISASSAYPELLHIGYQESRRTGRESPTI